MKALSIRQPWAWLILNAGKDVENRNWRTNFRGRIYIHAAATMTRREYEDAMDWVVCSGIPLNFEEPHPTRFMRGGIIGSVEIVDCVEKSESPWFVGKYGFVLKNPIRLPFQPCKGRLHFFTPSPLPDFLSS